jgi:hypothetical protein
VRRNEGRSLFGGAVDIDGNKLAMPVQLFGRIGVVVNIHDDPLAFRKPYQRSRKLAVVERRRNNALRRQLNKPGGNLNRVVGLFGVRRIFGSVHKAGRRER